MAVADPSLRRFPLDGRLAAIPAGEAGNVILDCTSQPRIGLRGPGVPAWLSARRLPFPEAINRTASFDGGRIARLGPTEVLILPDPSHDGTGFAELTKARPPLAPGVHDTFRDESWAWFRIQGADASDAMARLTSADVRPSRTRTGDVIQTRAAELDAVLIIGGTEMAPAFDLFTDIASASFLADVFAHHCPGFVLCGPRKGSPDNQPASG